MLKDYVPPQFKLDAFNCPHPECGAYAHQEWSHRTGAYTEKYVKPQFSGWLEGLCSARCERCYNYSLWENERLIFPQMYVAPVPSTDMPDEVKGNYEEARSIFNQSPRGAAALLRLTIEKLVIALGENGENLNENIGCLVKEGLPERIHKALYTVRVIGDNTVHPGQITVEDNRDVALDLFTLVNLIVETMITKIKKID